MCKTECETTRETDNFYQGAVSMAKKKGEISVSMLQRRLAIGYNRANRLFEAMDDAGLLGPRNTETGISAFIGDKPKMTREEALKIIEDFGKAGGNLFIDGCTGLTDKDIICIAKDCQILLAKTKSV